jgi:hypothetical protein
VDVVLHALTPCLLHAEKSKETPYRIHGVPCYIWPLYRVSAVICHTSAKSFSTSFWSHIYMGYNFLLITLRTYIILPDVDGILINWMAIWQQKRLYSVREKRGTQSITTCKKNSIDSFMTLCVKVRKVKEWALKEIPYLRNRNSFEYFTLWSHTKVIVSILALTGTFKLWSHTKIIVAILALTRTFKLTTIFGSIHHFHVKCLPPGYKLWQKQCTPVTIKIGGKIILNFKVVRCVSLILINCFYSLLF